MYCPICYHQNCLSLRVPKSSLVMPLCMSAASARCFLLLFLPRVAVFSCVYTDSLFSLVMSAASGCFHFLCLQRVPVFSFYVCGKWLFSLYVYSNRLFSLVMSAESGYIFSPVMSAPTGCFLPLCLSDLIVLSRHVCSDRLFSLVMSAASFSSLPISLFLSLSFSLSLCLNRLATKKTTRIDNQLECQIAFQLLHSTFFV